MGEATRERAEMVSNRVHTQLLQIADEKAMAAEKRAQELEREVRGVVEGREVRVERGGRGEWWRGR